MTTCGDQIAGSLHDGLNGSNCAIGYEPLCAIGSGQVPTAAQITEMHAYIRRCLVALLGAHGDSVRILYGGSVKPDSARTILAKNAGVAARPATGWTTIHASAHGAQDAQTVSPRQVEVEQDQVVMLRTKRRIGRLPVLHPVNGTVACPKQIDKRLTDHFVVFHQQESHVDLRLTGHKLGTGKPRARTTRA